MLSIEVTILTVMETWPLQLTASDGRQEYYIALTERTEILSAGKATSARSLRPGVAITVQGQRGATGGITAERISVRAGQLRPSH